jgi:hypothetical protein
VLPKAVVVSANKSKGFLKERVSGCERISRFNPTF